MEAPELPSVTTRDQPATHAATGPACDALVGAPAAALGAMLHKCQCPSLTGVQRAMEPARQWQVRPTPVLPRVLPLAPVRATDRVVLSPPLAAARLSGAGPKPRGSGRCTGRRNPWAWLAADGSNRWGRPSSCSKGPSGSRSASVSSSQSSSTRYSSWLT